MRVSAYLDAVAERLAPLSRAFVQDVAAFAPAEEVYRRNTAAAADRIRELIADGSRPARSVRSTPRFVAEIVAATMVGIQSGQMSRRLGMSDSDAYAELAALVVHVLAR